MDKLQQARQIINQVDKEMASLYRQRMEAVKMVLEHKLEHNLPVLDTAREQAVIAQNSGYVDKELRPYYTAFLQDLMKNSRRYQKDHMAPATVAYQGVEGAFSHIVADTLFESSEKKQYKTFAEVVKAVQSGEADAGILPFENSYTGEVGDVLDLLYESDVRITKMFDLQITQNLLSLPDAGLSDIKTVYSHPQALAQSALFLSGLGAQQIPYPNTAAAAKFVKEQGDISAAAIASEQTAKLYGLKVLAPKINTSAQNTTRFIVISNSLKTGGDRFGILFSIENEAGSLAEVIGLISQYGFNMESIHSRSKKELPWEYYFYIQLQGDMADDAAAKMLQKLAKVCKEVKILGSFDFER